MPDLNPPIVVSANTGAKDATTALLRYLVVTALTFAVGRGYIDADNVEGIAAGIIAVGVAGYGLIKTFRRGKQSVELAHDAPNARVE